MKKFILSLRSELSPMELLIRAKSEYAKVRSEMSRIARLAWPIWVKNEAEPSDEAALIRRVLNEIALDHTEADDILAFCKAENVRMEAFVKERDLLTLAEEPLKIIWTPEFLRSTAGIAFPCI